MLYKISRPASWAEGEGEGEDESGAGLGATAVLAVAERHNEYAPSRYLSSEVK
jgi:hypothetical protein